MLEFFMFPVSGVMKLWHILLHHGFGMDSSTAWMCSLFGLIITVRSIIAPLSWMQMKNARVMINLRPKIKKLEIISKTNKNPELARAVKLARQDLYERYNYKTSRGCFPILIQMPVFIGLYQVLLRMARPKEGLDTHEHPPIGFLTSTDIEDFINGQVKGVPFPAYLSMSPEQLAHLNTTHETVSTFIIPFLIMAGLFTSVNMAYSSYRIYRQVDPALAMSRWTVVIMLCCVPLVPFFIIKFGLTGPAPVAIILYWFTNNCWTMSQLITIHTLLDRSNPYTDEFKETQMEAKKKRKKEKQAKRRRKWGIRGRRLLMLIMPWKFSELHKKNKEAIQEKRDAKAKKKAAKAAKKQGKRDKKAQRKKNKAARKIARKEAKAKAKEAKKKGLPWPPPPDPEEILRMKEEHEKALAEAKAKAQAAAKDQPDSDKEVEVFGLMKFKKSVLDSSDPLTIVKMIINEPVEPRRARHRSSRTVGSPVKVDAIIAHREALARTRALLEEGRRKREEKQRQEAEAELKNGD